MTTRALIADDYYPEALTVWEKQNRPFIESEPSYEAISAKLADWCFGTADFWSRGLRALGWEAQDVVLNCVPLRMAWTREHGRLPANAQDWALEQVKRLRPDVVIIQNLSFFNPDLLLKMRAHSDNCKIVAHVSHRTPGGELLAGCDLIVTSIPGLVTEYGEFRRTEFLPLGADPIVLERIEAPKNRDVDVSFVGGISRFHQRANGALEQLAKQFPKLAVWGWTDRTIDSLPNLKRCWRGPVFGAEYYQALMRSRVTINRHGEIAGRDMNNQRAFEAPLVGCAVVTDGCGNVGDYFQIGDEVETWHEPDELYDAVRRVLNVEGRAEKMGQTAQARVIREHSWSARMEKLAEMVDEL